MRRSGVSPAVTRSKLARGTPRRAAWVQSVQAGAEVGGPRANGVGGHERMAGTSRFPAPFACPRASRRGGLSGRRCGRRPRDSRPTAVLGCGGCRERDKQGGGHSSYSEHTIQSDPVRRRRHASLRPSASLMREFSPDLLAQLRRLRGEASHGPRTGREATTRQEATFRQTFIRGLPTRGMVSSRLAELFTFSNR